MNHSGEYPGSILKLQTVRIQSFGYVRLVRFILLAAFSACFSYNLGKTDGECRQDNESKTNVHSPFVDGFQMNKGNDRKSRRKNPEEMEAIYLHGGQVVYQTALFYVVISADFRQNSAIFRYFSSKFC